MGAPVPDDRSAVGHRGGWTRASLDVLLGVVAPAVALGTMYLLPFLRHPSWPPFGFDTYGYAWRAALVSHRGLDALTELPDRPAHPVLVSLLGTVTRGSALEVMRVLPAVLASAVGLSAAEAAAQALHLDRRRAGLVGVAVGGSAFVAWTAVGYSSNLAIDPLLIAGTTLALRWTSHRSRRDLVGAILLLAAATLYHWPLSALFAVFLAGCGLAVRILARSSGRHVVPGATHRRSDRAGTGLALVPAIALPIGGVLLLASMPVLPQRVPRGTGGGIHHIAAFAAERMPAMALGVTLPIALLAAGVLALDRGSRPPVRLAAGLFGAWALLGGVGAAAWYWLRIPTPPYRWAGLALAVPLLVAAAPLEVGRAWRRGPAAVLAVVVGAAPAAWLAARGAQVWWTQRPPQPPALYRELETVAAYAEALEPSARIVLPTARRIGPILAGLPPALYDRLRFAPAAPAPPAAAQHPRRGADALLFLRCLNPGRPSMEGTSLAPGVTLVRGPLPAVPLRPARPFPDRDGTILMAATAAAALALAGGGWSVALSGTSLVGAVALSPSFGIAVLGLGGTIAARAGITPSGAGGVAVLVVLGLIGTVAAGRARRLTTRLGPRPRRRWAPRPGPPGRGARGRRGARA